MKTTATFTPTKWDEEPCVDLPKPMRVTKASVEFAFKGSFEGTGQTEFVMFYTVYDEKDPHASTAVYVGVTCMSGTLNGKKGSFALEERGTFEGGSAKSASTIVTGSGTEELKSIRGSATSVSTQNTSQC